MFAVKSRPETASFGVPNRGRIACGRRLPDLCIIIHQPVAMPRMAPKTTQLMIRLALHGCNNRPFYHLVVMQGRANRNAAPMEQLGTYDPMPNIRQEKLVAINFERLKYWLASGAHCSKPVEKLLGLSGFYPIHPMSYMEAKRNRKKATEKEAAEKAAAEDNDTESSSL